MLASEMTYLAGSVSRYAQDPISSIGALPECPPCDGGQSFQDVLCCDTLERHCCIPVGRTLLADQANSRSYPHSWRQVRSRPKSLYQNGR